PHDVASADKGAVEIELRNGRPIRVDLDLLADCWMREHVDGVERKVVIAKDIDHRGRKPALRPRRRALHEERRGMCLDGLGDLSVSAFSKCSLCHEDAPSGDSGTRSGDLATDGHFDPWRAANMRITGICTHLSAYALLSRD